MRDRLKYRKLEFTEAMCIGYLEIDDEHRDLVGIVNDIAIARDQGNAKGFNELILNFTDSVKKHFRKEEKILEKLGFRRLDEHITHHLNIENNVETIFQDLGGNIQDQEKWDTFYDGLISVLVDDAIKSDMDFKSFLMEKKS